MKRIIYPILFCIALPIFRIQAQQVMTLEQCREMAIENNKQMAIAERTNDKALTDVKAYRANYFPKLSLSGNYLFSSASSTFTIPGGYLPTYVPGTDGSLVPNLLTTNSTDPVFKEYAYMPDTEFKIKMNNSYTASLLAEQPIYMGGKITAAYRMAKIGRDLAGLNGNLTRSEVLVITDEAYWNYVKACELRKVAEQYKGVVEELLRNVEAGHEVGMVQRNNVLKVQVKLNEAELQLRKTENATRLARMNLCHVIGLPLTTEIALPETFETVDSQISYSADISQRPEYVMLDKQVELKRQQTKLVQSEFLPNIGVAAMYNYTYGVKINDKPLLDNTSFGAVVSVKIPLFQWGEGRNKVRSARTEQKIAELKQADVNEKMELELMKAINEVDEAQLEVKLTKNSLAEAEENLKTHKDMYENGMATLVDYLEAQTAWQKAGADQINANAALRLSLTRYQKASGKL
jgi:outer membrane protein TolC